MSHGCIHLTLSWNDRMLNGMPKHHRARKWCSIVRCSDSHARHVLQPKWTWIWPSHANWYDSVHPCRIKWGQIFSVNNQNCLSMASFCSGTMQNLIAMVMCKIWCNIGVERCWHILPTLQILPHVITGYLHTLKNILRVNNLNQNTISTLLSLPIYIIWARMNRELQLIVYERDGKRVQTVLVTTWSRGHLCTHSETEKYQ